MFIKRRTKRAIVEYLFSNKNLCDNTIKRIDKVIVLLNEYREKTKRLTLDDNQMIFDIIDGLIALKTGTTAGFKIYEDNKTEEKMKRFVKE